MSIKVLSIFSGAGGLDLGFKKAGYSIIASAEKMKEAVDTHNKNFKLKSKPIDLSREDELNNFINNFKFKKIDLLIGGFPCQGYSLAGKRNLNDKRNQLYKVVAIIIKKLKIKNFVLENVPGILSLGKENKLKEIEKIERFFNERKLYFKYKILDSSNFNVPQKRKRVIFIGTSIKKEISKIELIFTKLLNFKKQQIPSKKALKDLENIDENKNFNHTFTKHSNDTKKKIEKLEIGKSLYDTYSDGWRKIDYNKPAPTVKENHGGVHIHPVKNRFLTARELARLQTFPDDFIFEGSKKMQLVQIGNAVPVELSKHIAKEVKTLFKK